MRLLSSPESLHTCTILAQCALGFHNMTVRSEEEFSPKHSGIQTDTQATVIAAVQQQGWVGDIRNVLYHVCLVLTDAPHDLLARSLTAHVYCLNETDLTSHSISQWCIRASGVCREGGLGMVAVWLLPTSEWRDDWSLVSELRVVFLWVFFCIHFHISSRTLVFLNLSLACGGSG